MKKIMLLCLLLLSLTACKTKENEKRSSPESQESSYSIRESTSTKTTLSATTTVDSSTEQLTKKTLTDPQEIYSALKGGWLTKEIDGNNVQWQATFTDDSAIIAPVSGVASTLNFKISSLDWDQDNQRLTIAVEAYTSAAERSPENDYFLAVHDIDFTNFSQMSIVSTTFANTDMTYFRK